jgi:hypothetical protein
MPKIDVIDQVPQGEIQSYLGSGDDITNYTYDPDLEYDPNLTYGFVDTGVRPKFYE